MRHSIAFGLEIVWLLVATSQAWSSPLPLLLSSNRNDNSSPSSIPLTSLQRMRGGTLNRDRNKTRSKEGTSMISSSGFQSRRFTASKHSSIASTTADNDHDNTSSQSISPQILYSVLAILTATCLNLLGFTMTSPLSPSLGQHFALPLGASFGSLTSAYPLGMLVGLFLWPRLSDTPQIGRKPILVASLFGSGLGLSVQSWAIYRHWSLKWFLFTRVCTGVFSGTSPVAKAYLADVGASSGLLPKFLAWRDASSTLAYILGPVLGGFVFEARKASGGGGVGNSAALAFVIGLSALASLVASALIVGLVPNPKLEKDPSSRSDARESDKDKTEEQLKEEYELVSCPLGVNLWTGVASVCVVSALYHVADSTFFAFFPALLQKQLQLDAGAIGLVFTAFACVSFLFSASSASNLLIKKIGVVNTCATGLGSIGAGLLGLSVAASTGVVKASMVLGAAALYFCGVPLYGPTIPTMLLLCVPPYQRGTGTFSLEILSFETSCL